MKSFAVLIALISSLSLLSGCSRQGASDGESKPVVTVYSERKEHLIKPMFDRFSAETGITVRYITDNAGPLITRLESEGESTPADILMTVDAGNLWIAEQKGLLRSIESPVLKRHIPEHLRSPNNTWFGLSTRARTIVYAIERVDPAELSTYENLADPKWEGRLCLRTAKKVYNQSLVATMINTLGTEATGEMIKGWVKNLATDPYSNDTLAIDAVVAGQCDVTVVNTYYLGRMLVEKPDLPVKIFWPNQQGRGVHINISGAGITQHAKHPQPAQQLLEWLSSAEAQYQFAELNMEYPANESVKPAPLVASWGEFKKDMVNLEAAGRLQSAAVKLMDKAGYH